MEKVDRRIKRTHNLLTNALVTLALQKGYDAVTIRDITDQADISYSTFFRHFPDKDALFMSFIADVMHEMRDLIGNHEPVEEQGTVLFQHIFENQSLYKVLLGGLSSSAMVQRVQAMIVEAILHEFPLSSSGFLPPEIAANHFAASALALVKWWLDNDLPYSPEKMGAIYLTLIVKPLQAP